MPKENSPVHSVAILPDGSTLPLPDCGRYIVNEPTGVIIVYSKKYEKKTILLLPRGSTLITNWTHPHHA